MLYTSQHVYDFFFFFYLGGGGEEDGVNDRVLF